MLHSLCKDLEQRLIPTWVKQNSLLRAFRESTLLFDNPTVIGASETDKAQTTQYRFGLLFHWGFPPLLCWLLSIPMQVCFHIVPVMLILEQRQPWHLTNQRCPTSTYPLPLKFLELDLVPSLDGCFNVSSKHVSKEGRGQWKPKQNQSSCSWKSPISGRVWRHCTVGVPGKHALSAIPPCTNMNLK